MMNERPVVQAMTERDVVKLWQLLDKFSRVTNKDGKDHLTVGERQIVRCVKEWVRWYAHDEMSVELS